MTLASSTCWKTAALIGAGRMGKAHALALRELGVQLGAVCDRREEARAVIGDEFGIAADRRFADAADMYAVLGALDLVMVATTADTHAELTLQAAAAGVRSILCEKPMATSVADCRAMVAACADSGSRLAINHQMRFMEQYRLVKREFDLGALGMLASMNVVAGCFGLAMNGSHYIEAFHYLTGQFPVEATAWFSGEPFANPRGPAFADQAGEMRFVTADGRRLNFEIGADQGHGMTVLYTGNFGHIFVDELAGKMVVTARLPEHRAQPPTRYGMPNERCELSFAAADNVAPTKAVLAALAEGRDFPDGTNGLQIVSALAASYASVERGNIKVRLDELGDIADRHFPWA